MHAYIYVCVRVRVRVRARARIIGVVEKSTLAELAVRAERLHRSHGSSSSSCGSATSRQAATTSERASSGHRSDPRAHGFAMRKDAARRDGHALGVGHIEDRYALGLSDAVSGDVEALLARSFSIETLVVVASLGKVCMRSSRGPSLQA